ARSLHPRCRRHRLRARRPAARAGLCRSRPERRRCRQAARAPGGRQRRPHAVRRAARAGCPGSGHRPLDRHRQRRRPGPARRHHARHSVLLAYRDRPARHPRRSGRSPSPPARRSRADAPLDDRAEDHRVRRGLPGQAPRLRRRRRGLRRPLPGAHRRGQVLRGDRLAAVHRGRGRKALGRGGRRAVRGLRRAHRPDDAGPGRAGEDLDQHHAVRDVRAAEPADDGLRAVRRQRLRRHRAHQPRLSARGHGPARLHGRHLPAEGLRVLRGALARSRHASRRLARQRVGAAVPRRGHGPPPRHARQPEGRRPRPGVQGRDRRRARFPGPQARTPARAGARGRRDPRSARHDADAVLRRRGAGRRRGGPRHQPPGVLRNRPTATHRHRRQGDCARRRPVGLLRRRTGLRLRQRDRRAVGGRRSRRV
ncbi:MAG: UDP-glucose/GDP-mannose dehydrogenase, partial [uncultured Solirubrobacteraceae bacterium]